MLSSVIRDLHTTSVNADVAEIPTATDFVDQFAAAFGIDPLVSQMINVVLVDALSNIIAYGYDDAGGHQITLEFEMGSERLDLVVTDDGRARDLRSQPMPDTTADREESEIAGLTTALLRRCTDGVSYRRHDEKNILTLSFRLDRLPEQRENRGMSAATGPSDR
ncbi:MAG: ATP-binding protein [Phycisphaerales bacterium]